MDCTKPIRLSGVDLPCGKCISCKIAKTRDWSARLLQELDQWSSSCFLSLTYDDEHLPEGSTLVKKELQDFMKRLRKNTALKLRYYAVGEYGDDNGRPHYHIILFGLWPSDYPEEFSYTMIAGKPIWRCKSWTNGFVHVGTVTAESVRYVTDYVQKKLTGPLAETEYGGRALPFALQSQGLGKEFALANKDQLFALQSMTVHGVQQGVPRSYRKWIGLKNTDITRQLEGRAFMVALDKYVGLMEKTGSMDIRILTDLSDAQRKQLSKNLIARFELKGKKG